MGSQDPFTGQLSAELVQLALHTDDEDARWAIVCELHTRGSETELELARALMAGGEREQRLACDVLGQLGYLRRELGAYPFGLESAALLARALRSPAPEVQQAAIIAAGHQRWETLVEDVIAHATSRDADVRHAVAVAIGGRTDDQSIHTLIELSQDSDEDVRNWATFGIGSLCERRDAFICDALAARLGDVHDETRGEAWTGLATKGDVRAFDAVLRSLESDTLHVLAIEAAEAYRHPVFLASLERWSRECEAPDDEHFRGLLESAIQACRAGGLA